MNHRHVRHNAVVRLLLERVALAEVKSDEVRQPLWLPWEAAANGHEAVIRLLQGKGADIETNGLTHNWTPLFIATEWGHEAIVKLLLDQGAKVEKKILETAAHHYHGQLGAAIRVSCYCFSIT